jgi:hypothetical protein
MLSLVCILFSCKEKHKSGLAFCTGRSGTDLTRVIHQHAGFSGFEQRGNKKKCMTPRPPSPLDGIAEVSDRIYYDCRSNCLPR